MISVYMGRFSVVDMLECICCHFNKSILYYKIVFNKDFNFLCKCQMVVDIICMATRTSGEAKIGAVNGY